MGEIVNIADAKNKVIDLQALQRSKVKSAAGLIAPAKEETHCELAPEHAAEPIKSLDDIYAISEFLISNKRYRLRVSDLRMLRFSNLINDNFTFRDNFPVFEKKTRNTRKRKKNRYITINTAVIEAVTLYLENTPGVTLSDYLFRSESNRGKSTNQPLSKQSIDRILKGIAVDLHLNIRIATHSLRKTFCYHQMVMSNNDSRKLLLLQKMLNHSSPAQTLDYIGITSEEIEAAYKELNLGGRTRNYLMDSNIVEVENFAV